MKIIDRYVVIQFLQGALFSLIAFISIFILVDIIEKMNKFIDNAVPLLGVAEYYVYFTPQIISLMVPVAMLLAGLFTAGRMSAHNEITVLKASGLSLYRYMAPLLFIGLAVTALMIYFDGWVLPSINGKRIAMERRYFGRGVQGIGKFNLFFQGGGMRIVSMNYFDASAAEARRVSLQRFDTDDPTFLVERYDARRMTWDSLRNTWVLREGLHRVFSRDTTLPVTAREVVNRFDSIRVGGLSITPEIIMREQQKPEEVELDTFRDYIERQREAGSDISRLLVEYHGKIAFPFASFIVVLFGVPFAFQKRRAGLSVQFGVSILICFLYLVFQKVSQVFGYNGDLNPLVAAWLANGLFLIAGIIVLFRVRK